MCFPDPWPCIRSAVTRGGTEPFLFWVQVRRAVRAGVTLQLITAQPGRGLGKRFSKALFLLKYLPLCCLGEVKRQQGKEPDRVQWWGSAFCQPSGWKEGAGAPRSAGVWVREYLPGVCAVTE